MICFYAKMNLVLFDELICYEVFFNANSYTDAMAKIEDKYKDELIDVKLYALDTEFLYVEDIEDILKDARK